MLDNLSRDVAFALRSLRRARGFTLAAVLILGLGIGMSTAMFTVYRAVVVDRLPVLDQDRLIVMHPLDRGGAHLDVPLAYLDEIRRNSRTLRQVAGVYHLGAVPAPLLDRGVPVDLVAAYTTANLFDVLGSRPVLGRLLRPSDGAAGAPKVMVLSYASWRRQFGEDSLIVGRTLIEPYDQSRVTIVGVAPPGLEYPAGADAWRPLPPEFTLQVDIVGRLAPGATSEAARSDLYALTQRVNPFAHDANGTFRPKIAGVDARGFTTEVLGNARPALVILTVAVGLLLLIACVNVGNLILVRGAGRSREIAVRRAIGATYGDLARQLLVENAILGIAGGVVGLVCADWLLALLLHFAPPQLPRTDVLGASGAPLGVAIGITMLAVLVFGLLPSMSAARVDPNASLRSDTRAGSEAVARRRVRRWLVSSQVALALVMIAGAALLARSLERLQRIDLGYTPEHLSLLTLTGSKSVFPSEERANQVLEELMRRVRAVPGVSALTPVESPPFRGRSFFITKIARAEQSAADGQSNPYIPFEIGGPDYFRTFQIPIVRGRAFLDSDRKGTPPVVVVSEELARRLWPGQDAVGKQLRYVYDSTGTLITVVGVAHDTRFRALRDVAPVIYQPWRQQEYLAWWGLLAVRTTGDFGATMPSIRSAVHDYNPGLTVVRGETMDQLIAGPLAQPRLSTLLLSAFGVVALMLAAIGLYGVMSSAVRQQAREIGIRVALGATPGRVRRLVLRDAAAVLGAGALIGLGAALLSTRLLSSQLFGISPTDPMSLVGACAILLAVGLCAAYAPARWATKIDPARALRQE
ncbi:MAG TPA: ABC transporter permease [Gemmatimonadaceae bacterium]|nr:ABC transporter permease [Gemmatimonadaceae bacterium]